MIQYLEGDATRPEADGLKFIIHVANNSGGWGRGFVLALSDRWTEPESYYRAQDELPLGTIQVVGVEPDLAVISMIAQDGYQRPDRPIPLDMDALRECFSKVAALAKAQDASVHMSRIGCGLAGGDWDDVAPLVEAMDALGVVCYVYDLPPKGDFVGRI